MVTSKARAAARGYQFQGAYEYKPELLQNQLNRLRDAGYKAVIVRVPPSKLSLTGSGGYAIHVEPRYFKDREIERLVSELNQIPDQRMSLLNEHKRQLREINMHQLDLQRRLSLLGIEGR